MIGEDAVESAAVMLAELQALRQTALQAVDTATANILAKGRDTVNSAAGHDRRECC
jgi:hypothetical protein